MHQEKCGVPDAPVNGRGPKGHAHHWIIGAAEGPTAKGHCDCGEEREFKTGYEGYDTLREPKVEATAV